MPYSGHLKSKSNFTGLSHTHPYTVKCVLWMSSNLECTLKAEVTYIEKGKCKKYNAKDKRKKKKKSYQEN